jgi:hypothetical protein
LYIENKRLTGTAFAFALFRRVVQLGSSTAREKDKPSVVGKCALLMLNEKADDVAECVRVIEFRLIDPWQPFLEVLCLDEIVGLVPEAGPWHVLARIAAFICGNMVRTF